MLARARRARSSRPKRTCRCSPAIVCAPQRGRVEILFADGSALDLDEDTSIDLLSDSLVRLRAGRIRLSIARQTEDLDYRIDAAGVSSIIHTAGEYRVSLSDRHATKSSSRCFAAPRS